MNLAEKVRQAGVVGFPTHIKLNASAETVIANGAECEPLLHKDAVIMKENAAELVRGMQLAMEAIGAREGIIGKLIPPGGIPINVGVVVNNVETFVNIAAANDGRPLTHKILTIAGAIESPATMRVPLVTTFRERIEHAGGLATDDPVLVIGRLMMGQHTDNLDTPRDQDFRGRRDIAAHASRYRTQAQAGQSTGQNRQIRM